MKIGIIGGGYDMLPLWSMLSQHNHEYIFYVDHKHAPFAEKSFNCVSEQVLQGINYCLDQHTVDFCIVPPLQEIELLYNKSMPKNIKEKIFPLFSRFLHAGLADSRIGKIGLLTTRNETEHVESLFDKVAEEYILNEKQENTNNFHYPFATRTKTVRMWSYYLMEYSKRDWMVRKTVKNDCSYFRDADVDTLLPTSWDCLYYGKIISRIFSSKRTYWQGMKPVKDIFEEWLSDGSDIYSVEIFTTDPGISFPEERKWERLLTRGGSVELPIHLL